MSDSPEVMRHDGFGKKLGFLPVWAWALLLAAGVFIFYRFYGGRSSSANTALGNTDLSGLGVNSASPGSPSSSDNGNGRVSFYDNGSWEAAAISEASQFDSDPLSVQHALGQYLTGADLSPAQGSLINRILSALGAPPLGTKGDSNIVTPGSTPVTPTPTTPDYSKFTIVEDGQGSIGIFNPGTNKTSYAHNVPQLQYIQAILAGDTPPKTSKKDITAAQQTIKDVS